MVILPEHIHSKIADPAERRRYGRTKAEALAKETKERELELHNQYISFLRRNDLLYVHANPTKRATIRPGWPDFSVFRDGRVLFVEFKLRPNKVTAKQEVVINELIAAGCTVLVEQSYEEASKATARFFNL